MTDVTTFQCPVCEYWMRRSAALLKENDSYVARIGALERRIAQYEAAPPEMEANRARWVAELRQQVEAEQKETVAGLKGELQQAWEYRKKAGEWTSEVRAVVKALRQAVKVSQHLLKHCKDFDRPRKGQTPRQFALGFCST